MWDSTPSGHVGAVSKSMSIKRENSYLAFEFIELIREVMKEDGFSERFGDEKTTSCTACSEHACHCERPPQPKQCTCKKVQKNRTWDGERLFVKVCSGEEEEDGSLLFVFDVFQKVRHLRKFNTFSLADYEMYPPDITN